MTVMLGIDALDGAISMREAIDLLEGTLAHEVAGKTSASPKFVTSFNGGAMRVLVAADSAAGYVAMKAYHSIEGVGTRYVVMLYRLTDGELLAIVDGRIITDLRTGAASGVIARKVDRPGPVTVGILGSGNQARTQRNHNRRCERARSGARRLQVRRHGASGSRARRALLRASRRP